MILWKNLGASWAYAKAQTPKHYKILIWASIIYGFTLAVPDIISLVIRDTGEIYYLAAILLAMLSLTLNLGIIHQVFQLENNQALVFSDLFRYGKYLIPLLGINVLIGIPTLLLGLLLLKYASYLLPILIVLVIYFGIRASFFGYFIVDKKVGVLQSFILSIKATPSQFWPIFLLSILELVLLVIGFIPLGIGILWVIPFATFMNTYYYKNFLRK